MKFNKLGQWSLEKDVSNGTISGMSKTENLSSIPEKTHDKRGIDTAIQALQQIEKNQLPQMNKAIPQPTDEQLFGHLAVSEEEAKKLDAEWKNRFSSFLLQKNIKVDALNKNERLANQEWGVGKSFNSMLTEEEVRARNLVVDEK